MSRSLRPAALAALASLALLSSACTRGPDVRAPGLALRRVVIYRNGVGYFERQGQVDADEVTFRVRRERVGDFLATLAVIERGGSSVRSASFPVEVEKKKGDDAGDDEAQQNKRYEILLKAPPQKADEKKDDLETVKLSLDGKEHDLVVGYVAETPVWRPSYRLIVSDKKTSAAPTADLQAWGIIQNLSGEDWKQVKLSLVAGAPLAFQSTLDKAVIPERPTVTDQGEVISSVPTGETSLANELAPPPPPPPPPPPEVQAQTHSLDELMKEKDDDGEGEAQADNGRLRADGRPRRPSKKTPPSGHAGGGGKMASRGAMGGYRAGTPAAPAARPAEPMRNPSPPRNVSALAGVAMEAGTTRYDLPFAVDVPNKSATMVLLLSQEVPGEAIFLFAPDGGVPESSFHPFRVARFVNNTKGLLERGPIAVFESGSFLGQGMVEPLPPGAAATVPFALERSIAVELARSDNQESSRLARIESGEIEIERDSVTHTKYSLKNGSDEVTKILVKHLRSPGTRLNAAPKGTEDNVGTGSALVPFEVPKRTTGVLDVDERRAYRQSVNPLEPLADDAVKVYLADPRADQAVVGPLRAAWQLRTKLREGWDEHDKLTIEKSRLESESEQLRLDLKAIEKDKTADKLRKEHTERLAKASTRVGEITKRLIEIDTALREQSIRFRDMLNGIKMLKPLSPPA